MNTPDASAIPIEAPRFQVSADARGQAVVQAIVPKRVRNPAKLLPAGTGFVQIFGRSPGPFTIAWRGTGGGPRERAMRSKWTSAKSFAERKATELANLQSGIRKLSPVEATAFLRALEILAPTGKQLELALAEYTEAVQILAGAGTVAEACRWFMEHRPVGVTPKKVPDLVDLLLKQKRKDGNGAKGIRTLEHQLEAFGEKFGGPFHLARAPEINAWLRSLDVGLRTRKNYRAAVVELARFAHANNFLAKSWDELKRLDKIKPLPTEAFIWTAEQMTRLLGSCPDNLLPLLVLMSFGGVRHEEMSPEDKGDALLDWSNINMDKAEIRIPKTVAKTKRMRRITMQPNLVAWLRPYAKRNGPICELKATGDALYRLGQRAGITWVKNACRNSFISYRLAQSDNLGLVAREAGNSAKVIQDEYLALADEEQGKRWFAIFPKEEKDILRFPLFAWAEAK
jgi:integrase